MPPKSIDDDEDMSSSSPPSQITILSLNVWGLKHISAQRAPRIAAIASSITTLSPPPDIVGLQECFCSSDFEAVRAATASVLPHAKYFHSGAFGSGLAIFSRWPIEESCMTPYVLNGRPSAFWRGDWYVGKGIARAAVRIAPGDDGLVQVFNTHTHAPYGTSPHSQYTAHRLSQAWSLAQQITAYARPNNLVISLGDFNMLPDSLAHDIVSATPARDSWLVLHPESANKPTTTPTAQQNLDVYGATSNNVLNTWRWPKDRQKRLAKGEMLPVDPGTLDPRGQRLDYVFATTGGAWVVDRAKVVMTERHPDLRVSLSDHFGVLTTLRRHDGQVDESINAQLTHRPERLSLNKLDGIAATVRDFIQGEQAQQSWRAAHFYVSVLLWLASVVGAGFAGRYSIIVAVVGGLVLASGVVDGLIALLFFSSELNALKEFQWDVDNRRKLARNY